MKLRSSNCHSDIRTSLLLQRRYLRSGVMVWCGLVIYFLAHSLMLLLLLTLTQQFRYAYSEMDVASLCCYCRCCY